ncbi:hypothetical protein P5673_012092 [Acropora cervicornis]|uniref:Integrase catalytic domain-containing protein n=1 Tax=Acropora cervicornis TaxID=6130 RepID=A0AAD9QNP4_ACRCE|nr:hypothetical protein P5673_012092 [Acropora cervicornis]
MVVIPMQLQSTMVRNVHQGHQVGESTVHCVKCCIGRECVQQFFKKVPISLCGCRTKFHMVLGSSSQDLFKHALNEDITAAHVISVTKAHFAHYGVPDKSRSDNGSQYVSPEFANFGKAYGFQLITRSYM